MRASAAGILGAGLLAFSTAAAAAQPPNVTGTFVRSRGAPACFPGEPCDSPPPSVFVVFTRNGHATRVKLKPSGAFSTHLAPGLYTVSAAPAKGPVTPSTVRVPGVGVVHARFVQKPK